MLTHLQNASRASRVQAVPTRAARRIIIYMDDWQPQFQGNQNFTTSVLCFQKENNATLCKITPSFPCNMNGCQNTWTDNELLLPNCIIQEQARRIALMNTSAAIAQLETGLKNEGKNVDALMRKFYAFNGKWHHTHSLHGVFNRRAFTQDLYEAWVEFRFGAFTRDPVYLRKRGGRRRRRRKGRRRKRRRKRSSCV